MRHTKIALKHISVFSLLAMSLVACDKDFANLDSDLTDGSSKHFSTQSNEFDVVAYTKPVPVVQTSNRTSQQLSSALLGYYYDPLLGGTTSNLLTGVTPASYSPDFGENVKLDSVVLSIPYFSTQTDIDADGVPIFRLDSVYGNAPIDLSIYRSNYFLRDKDPNSTVNSDQLFYSNQSDGINPISDSQLESELLFTKESFVPSANVIKLRDDFDQPDSSYVVPSLRLQIMDPEDLVYWENVILDKENGSELSNPANFKNYFRGVYIKAEGTGTASNTVLLDLGSGGAITLYYTKDAEVDGEREQASYALNFNGRQATFIKNEFTIPEGNMVDGDDQLYLKGGAGSIAVINLFNGDNFDDEPGDNSFEQFKKEFVNTDEEGNYVSSRKLINEANLVFYVDQQATSMLSPNQEPDAIFLYNLENGTPLSINMGLGILKREGEDEDGRGIKYTIKLTEHINNLLLNDVINVKLGLAVLGNINTEFEVAQLDVLTQDDQNLSLPSTSISTPKATVLFGNNTADESKKLHLELFYTNIEQ